MGRPFRGGHVRTLGGETEYRLIWADGKQQLEHRLVLSRFLGRPLLRTEIVRHKDEDGLNNDIDNLEIVTQAEHRRLHGGPRHWLIAYEEAVRLRVEEKATLKSIASQAGVTSGAIRNVFVRRGIPTADARWGTNKWDVERAARRLTEGWTMRAIAKEVGVTAPSVRKALIARGLFPPTHEQKPVA